MAATPPRGEFTHPEITTQGEAWAGALEAVSAQATLLSELVREAAGGLLFVGCGSTFHLAQWAAPFFQRVTGLPCLAAPARRSGLAKSIHTTGFVARAAAARATPCRPGENNETLPVVRSTFAHSRPAPSSIYLLWQLSPGRAG